MLVEVEGVSVEKREYNKIWNWQEGCPNCDAKPSSYPAFRKHLSRGMGLAKGFYLRSLVVRLQKAIPLI